jgi:hypothetical protein
MLRGDATGQAGDDRAGEMCTAFGDRLPAKSSEPSATATSASSLGRESQHHITGGKLSELPGKSAPDLSHRPTPDNLFYKVDGKSVSHMAETDRTDMFGDEWGRSVPLNHRPGRSSGIID